MTCTVLTADRLDRALAHQLTDLERTEIRAHLREPCDACLETLRDTSAAALLEALAGPQARLSGAEADAMFGRAFPVAQPRSWVRPALTAIAAVFLSFVGWQLTRDDITIKGTTAPPEVSLLLFVSENDGPARRFDSTRPVRGSDALVLRYRLSKPARLALIDVTAQLVLWKSAEEAIDGEAPLTTGGEALAIPGGEAATLHSLRLVACPTARTDAEWLAAGVGAEGCTADTRSLIE